MRIARISDTFRLVGGTERYLDFVSRELHFRGHVVIQIGEAFPASSKEYLRFAVPDIRFIKRTGTAIRHTLDAIATSKPDVIHVHRLSNPLLLGMLVAQEIPLIRTLHSFDATCPITSRWIKPKKQNCHCPPGLICFREGCISPLSPRLLLRLFLCRYIEPWINRRVKRVLVASDFMKKLLSEVGVKARQIDVIGNVHEFWPCPVDPLSEDRILFAGRICEEKGIFDFLRLLSLLPVDIGAFVIGDGPDLQRAKLRARGLGLEHRIDFTGWLEKEEMCKRYDRCRAAVFPSLWMEPYGRTGVEAMTRGRPVVAYDTGGVQEWLQDGKNGFLVAPGDVEAMAAKVQKLMDDRSLADTLGAFGKEFVREHLSVKTHVDRLLEQYGNDE